MVTAAGKIEQVEIQIGQTRGASASGTDEARYFLSVMEVRYCMYCMEAHPYIGRELGRDTGAGFPSLWNTYSKIMEASGPLRESEEVREVGAGKFVKWTGSSRFLVALRQST